MRSTALLFAFPLLILAMLGAFYYFTSLVLDAPTYGQPVNHSHIAFEKTLNMAPIVFIGVGIWFVIAWLFYQRIIDRCTGAVDADPHNPDHKRAFRLLESLCLSRGVAPVPHLKIINSRVLNAYASGLSSKSYTVTLTSGLMRNLNDEELEGVIAHELAHILNRDVRLLVISIIFVGLLGLAAEFAQIFMRSALFSSSRSNTRSHNNNNSGQAMILVAVIAFAVIIVGWFFSQLLRFSLSRAREYLADAGAVEMTHNPAALARALRIISRRSKLDTPEAMQAMMIENPTTHLMGMFSTHPPIERRIAILNSWAEAEHRVS